MGGGSVKDIRAIYGITLLTETRELLSKMREDVEKLGYPYLKSPETLEMLRVIHRRMVNATGADEDANNFLVLKINQVMRKIECDNPWAPLVRKKLRETDEAFLIAIARHNQALEKVLKKGIERALGSDKVINEPQAHFNNSESYKKKRTLKEE